MIGDFRAPDMMRFGITPLFVGEAEILKAVDTLEDILKTQSYKEARFQVRSAVT